MERLWSGPQLLLVAQDLRLWSLTFSRISFQAVPWEAWDPGVWTQK